MMWMGKERQREKECPERESKTLKECNAGARERTSSHMIITAAVSIEIDLTLR